MARNGKAGKRKAGNGQAAHWVGKRLKRKEDPRLIQGISHYTDDLKMPNMLHCVLVRSPHAHAEIRAIRVDAARALPGIVAIFTGADTASVGSVPCAIQMPDLKVPRGGESLRGA
jgi:aerobic carbon-monoxide dehydrogenase large subunit